MVSRSWGGRSKKVFGLRGWTCTWVSSHASSSETHQLSSETKLVILATHPRLPCPMDHVDRPWQLKVGEMLDFAKLSLGCATPYRQESCAEH